jgi:outer membrane lipoprotein SlyB
MSEGKASPIVAIAAGSVIVFSLIGVGVMTGMIPSSRSQNTEAIQASATPAPETVAKSKPATAAAKRTSEPVRVASAKPAHPPAAQVCANCGTVNDIRVIEQKGEASGLGAIAGGVVGGVLGNQVGAGNGRKLATVAAAAGGAYAGHQIEKNMKSTKHYEVAVRMDDGAVRHFTYEAQPEFQPGDKVKVVDGRLVN